MTHKHSYEHPQPKTVDASSSWWISQPRDGFTAYIQASEFARMKTSRFGLIANKPYTTEEVSR